MAILLHSLVPQVIAPVSDNHWATKDSIRVVLFGTSVVDKVGNVPTQLRCVTR